MRKAESIVRIMLLNFIAKQEITAITSGVMLYALSFKLLMA